MLKYILALNCSGTSLACHASASMRLEKHLLSWKIREKKLKNSIILRCFSDAQ